MKNDPKDSHNGLRMVRLGVLYDVSPTCQILSVYHVFMFQSYEFHGLFYVMYACFTYKYYSTSTHTPFTEALHLKNVGSNVQVARLPHSLVRLS